MKILLYLCASAAVSFTNYPHFPSEILEKYPSSQRQKLFSGRGRRFLCVMFEDKHVKSEVEADNNVSGLTNTLADDANVSSMIAAQKICFSVTL